jgi:SAM-dependent methyltransferase
VIDVRSTEQVEERHIVGTTHIPLNEWSDRSLEFPPRKHAFAILAPAAASLSAAQRAILDHMLTALAPDCAALIMEGEEAISFWAAVPADRLAAGPFTLQQQCRVWQPSPLAPVFLSYLHPHLAAVEGERVRHLRVLDAGAGTGRNAVYLLQELPALAPHVACRVTAVDNRKSMCEKAVKFGARAGVSHALHVVQADIGSHVLQAQTEGDGYHVAAFFRFLDWPTITASVDTLRPWLGGPCAVHLDMRGGGSTKGPQHTEKSTAQACAGHAWIVVEHFHVDSHHPKEESKKLREGQVLTRLVLHESATGSLGHRWAFKVVHEARAECEDGRPMLQVVVKACLVQGA